jgi:hypothetical protein
MLVALLFALACDNEDRTIAAEARVYSAMARHRTEAEAARDAAIHGDLDGAKAEAAALDARLPLPDLPADLDPLQAELRAAAHATATATTLDGAAAGIGRIAVACGACHDVVHPAIVPSPPPATVEGDGVRAEMAVHQGGMQTIWLGMIRPSTADLGAGARALHASTLSPIGGPPSEAARAIDARVDTLAAELAATPLPADRGEVLGRLIVTCATCHLTRPGGIAIEPE